MPFVTGDRQMFCDQPKSNYISRIDENIIKSHSKKRPGKKQKIIAPKFRTYQVEKWQKSFNELLLFRSKQNHCLVPHDFQPNPSLAQWVKRQRYQFSLLMSGKQSSMTQKRIKLLENIGFTWDSHEACWQERLKELLDYKSKYGNCAVPAKFKSNIKLATWVKCQRRQYKLFQEGRPSNMTINRILMLENHGFDWDMRSSKSPSTFITKDINAFNEDCAFEINDNQSEVLNGLSDVLRTQDGNHKELSSQEFNPFRNFSDAYTEAECDILMGVLSDLSDDEMDDTIFYEQ